MTRPNQFVALFAVSMMFVLASGCDSLTRNRFEMIVVNTSTKFDVEQTIGPPNIRQDDMWHYERPERHVNVLIDFDDEGVVARKQWIDATTSEWSDSQGHSDSDTHESTNVRTIR